LTNFSGEGVSSLSTTNKVATKLFSFLLENLMSRYLFNLMLRKSPNIESWPLNDEDLSESNLKKYTFEQSFIRLYKCWDQYQFGALGIRPKNPVTLTGIRDAQ